jgi:hypothetical protein
MPTRIESVSIPYTTEDLESISETIKKVTVTYNGEKKTLTLNKEVNWAPKKNFPMLDSEKKLVGIEFNPTNKKDFDIYSGPPQYVVPGFLIFAGFIFAVVGLYLIYLQKDHIIEKVNSLIIKKKN